MKPERSWRSGRPAVVEYAAAILFVAVAAMVTVWLRKTFPATPNALFFCGVILSAWFGGWGPGLLAAILSSVAGICLPFSPFPGEGAGSEALRLIMYLFAGIFISWIC